MRTPPPCGALRVPAAPGRARPAGSGRGGRTRGRRRTPGPTGHRWNRTGPTSTSKNDGVEVGRLVDRAVERADVAGGRPAAGVHLVAEQLHLRPRGNPAAAADHTPSTELPVATTRHCTIVVGVLAGLALAQVETRAPRRPGCRTAGAALREHRAGVDAEEQRDDHDEQAADAAADRDARGRRPPPPPLLDVVLVSICIPSLKVIARLRPRPSARAAAGWAPAAFSFPHYDSGVAALCELRNFRPSRRPLPGCSAAPPRAASTSGAASPTPSSPWGSDGSWRPRRCSRGRACATPSSTGRCRRRAGRSSAVDATTRRSATRRV